MSTESSYLPAIEALEALGQSLKAVRLSRSKSLRKCAAEVGVSSSTITRVESGEACDTTSALAILRWLANPPVAATIEVRRNPYLDLIDEDAAADAEPIARVWVCAHCGKRDTWGPGWSWYGSLRQLDLTGEPEFVVCSPACRRSTAARRGHDSDVLDAPKAGADD